MQNQPAAKSIKVSQTGKGLYHWEDQLLENQRKRLNLILTRYEVDPWKKRGINQLFKSQVTRDNIIAVHSHPIELFLICLLDGDLIKLESFSSIKS